MADDPATWTQRETGPFALPADSASASSSSPRTKKPKPIAAPLSPDHAKVLNDETDARFWAQTGYKPGHKLDPKDPTDKSMARVWMDIYTKVKAEDTAGKLVLTHTDPIVNKHLTDAAVANNAAVVHLDAADAAAKDVTKAPEEKAKHINEHVKAATVATQISQQKTKEAAKLQPPTVSPAVAQAAAIDAHALAQVPPPNVKVFAPGHPVHWHPSAQPVVPELAMPAPIVQYGQPAPGYAYQAPITNDVTLPSLASAPMSPTPAPVSPTSAPQQAVAAPPLPIFPPLALPETAADHHALAQAAASPSHAGDVHEVAHGTKSSSHIAVIVAAVAASAGLFLLASRTPTRIVRSKARR